MQRQPSSAASTFAASAFFSSSSSRPTTRDGPEHPQSPPPPIPGSPSLKDRDKEKEKEKEKDKDGNRKSSFSRKASLSLSGARRRGTNASTTSVGSTSSPGVAPTSASHTVVTDAAAPPALPDYALGAAAKVASRERRDDTVWTPISPDGAFGFSYNSGAGLSRTVTSNSATGMPPPTPLAPNSASNGSAAWYQSEAAMIYQQICDVANKRISTLDYLRKAHEGRMYWFNTYLFDRPDLNRMPSFDPRKLARKATNHLLLGLSIPTINDLYSTTPLEFLRCLNSLLSEFDSFQQIHGDSSASLSRARLPNMFRRPGGKSRRSTSAADAAMDDGGQGVPSGGAAAGGGAGASAAPAVMNFAASESDLLPGEEYTYLLTPSLPFDPDFFETFATLCDVLIDCYTRFLALVPSPRECSAAIAELFTKADSKVRKIIVQGVVKEFDDHSRTHVKTEVANIGKVVLGGLM